MKYFLLFMLMASASAARAQAPINNLPKGKYETRLKNGSVKWEAGDIMLLDDGRYRISTQDETGEFRFSVAAQRLFFTSGPLKGASAITSINQNIPVIILPVNENHPLKLSAEVWGYYRQ